MTTFYSDGGIAIRSPHKVPSIECSVGDACALLRLTGPTGAATEFRQDGVESRLCMIDAGGIVSISFRSGPSEQRLEVNDIAGAALLVLIVDRATARISLGRRAGEQTTWRDL